MQIETTSAPSRDPLKLYIRDIARHDILPQDEQRELVKCYQKTGDAGAMERLVQSNLRLVIKLAREHRKNRRTSLPDLIQEGNNGLIHAVRKFDPDRNVTFTYYAAFWIRAYILRYILANWNHVKLSTTQNRRKIFFNLNRTRERLIQEGIDPTPRAIAERIDVSEAEVSEMMSRMATGHEMSLDEPRAGSEGRTHIDDLQSNGRPVDVVVSQLECNQIVRRLAARFKRHLDRREVGIFERRIYASDPVTLKVLGDHYGISRERVRQIEANILEKLKSYIREASPELESHMTN